MARWPLGVALGLVAGCHGAEVVSSDAASDDAALSETIAEDSAADAAGDVAPLACNVPGNLVRNPSFEVVSGGAVASWPAGLVSKTGGAYDCERYVEWRPAGTSDLLGQDYLGTGGEAPAGTSFEVSVWAKTIDGNTDPVVLWLEGAKDDYHLQPTSSVGTSWTRLSAIITLAKPTSQIAVAVRLGGEGARALAVDLVSVVRKS